MTPRERRQVAVAYLRSIPQEVADKHVDMRTFGKRAGRKGHQQVTLYQLLFECGTVACAGGWLCLVPPLMADGLDQDRHGYPTYQGKSGTGALMSFFSLTIEECDAIFYNATISGKAALDEVCRQLEAIP